MELTMALDVSTNDAHLNVMQRQMNGVLTASLFENDN